MNKYVIVRADASNEIGTGHIMRCLVLADALRQFYIDAFFICRNLPGHLSDYINQRGYRVFLRDSQAVLTQEEVDEDASYTIQIINEIGTTPEWIIVDHYGIEERWESMVRAYAPRLFVIDDLANRKHNADLLLDQNLTENTELRYRSLVSENCKLLLGPAYLLLRPAFYKERINLRQRTGEIHRLLVFFGGSDPTNETVKVLDALPQLPNTIEIDVIIGKANGYAEEIQSKCKLFDHVHLHVQVEDIDRFIVSADFALGAGGISMWERCFLGLPSAVTIVADNQSDSVNLAENMGAVWNMGCHNEINSRHYADMIYRAMNSPKQLLQLSECSLKLMNSSSECGTNCVTGELMGRSEVNLTGRS